MGRDLMTGRTGFLGSRALLRFLAAGDAGRIDESARHAAAAVRAAAADARDVQAAPRAPFIGAGREPGEERVDAVAGSEFVDDRLRWRE